MSALGTKSSYTGDGVTLTYRVPFPFVSILNVFVLVDNVGVNQGSDWLFVDASHIQFAIAPAAASRIAIVRSSGPFARGVEFVNGPFTPAKLDAGFRQTFYLLQELWDALAEIPLDPDASAAASKAATAASAIQAAALYAAWTPTDEPGPDGPKGPRGPIGPAGATGSKGPDGPVGIQGIQGIRGIRGITGEDGETGDKGPLGIIGEHGGGGEGGEGGDDGGDGGGEEGG